MSGEDSARAARKLASTDNVRFQTSAQKIAALGRGVVRRPRRAAVAVEDRRRRSVEQTIFDEHIEAFPRHAAGSICGIAELLNLQSTQDVVMRDRTNGSNFPEHEHGKTSLTDSICEVAEPTRKNGGLSERVPRSSGKVIQDESSAMPEGNVQAIAAGSNSSWEPLIYKSNRSCTDVKPDDQQIPQRRTPNLGPTIFGTGVNC